MAQLEAKAQPKAKAQAKPKPAAPVNSRKARLDAAWRRRVEAERHEADEAAKAQAEYEKEYRRMLPYLLEQQRQYLQRLSDVERNEALDRMARAAERQASAAGRMADAAWWAAYRR
jgi:hypothetical protein